jgi:hypothetical protein
MKKIMIILLGMVLISGAVLAEEGCFIRFTFNESLEGFELLSYENIYGNFEGFVPIASGVYSFSFYDSDNKKTNYEVETSLIMFYDNFNDSEDKGGMIFLNESIREIVIPYSNYQRLEISSGDRFWEFDLSNYKFSCERNCGMEGEKVDLVSGERCCEQFYPTYDYSEEVYFCLNEENYLENYNNYSTKKESFDRNFILYVFLAVIFLVILFFVFILFLKKRNKKKKVKNRGKK